MELASPALRLYPIAPITTGLAVCQYYPPIDGGKAPNFVPGTRSHLYTFFFSKNLYHISPDIYEDAKYSGGKVERDSRIRVNFQPCIRILICDPHRMRNCSHWACRCNYLLFNGGSRICIGREFALTDTSYKIVRLLHPLWIFDRGW